MYVYNVTPLQTGKSHGQWYLQYDPVDSLLDRFTVAPLRRKTSGFPRVGTPVSGFRRVLG